MRYKHLASSLLAPHERTWHALFPNTYHCKPGGIAFIFINLYEVGSDRPVDQDEKLDLEPSV